MRLFIYAGVIIYENTLKHRYLVYRPEDPLHLIAGDEPAYFDKKLDSSHKIGLVYWLEESEASVRHIMKANVKLHRDTKRILRAVHKAEWEEFVRLRIPFLAPIIARSKVQQIALLLQLSPSSRATVVNDVLTGEELYETTSIE